MTKKFIDLAHLKPWEKKNSFQSPVNEKLFLLL